MSATQTLDGKPILQKTDARNRTYYTGLDNVRISTAGREADIKTVEGADVPEEVETFTEELGSMTAFPFVAYSVALAAIHAGHGYAERGPYVANRCGEQSAILSMPCADGGNTRYLVSFPKTIVLPATVAE